jgi:E3 ubiquitin-protein ligase SIAH1
MDDISRALDEGLLGDLECPVCMEYMVPTIKLCTNGHNICSKCRDRIDCCPTCRAEFTENRNVALENIARSQKYPCANRQSGRLDLFSIEHIAEHNAVCVYGKIKCPFQVHGKCSWKGFRSDLKEHAKAAHTKTFFENSILLPPDLSENMDILSCFGELFTYY